MSETKNPGPLSDVVLAPEEEKLFTPESCKASIDRAMEAVKKINEEEKRETTQE